MFESGEKAFKFCWDMMLNNVENLNQYKSTKESFVTKISLAKEVKSTKSRPQQRQSVAHAHSISEKSEGDHWILFTCLHCDSPCSAVVFPKGKPFHTVQKTYSWTPTMELCLNIRITLNMSDNLLPLSKLSSAPELSRQFKFSSLWKRPVRGSLCTRMISSRLNSNNAQDTCSITRW